MVGTRNFVQPGEVLTLTAPSGGVVAGSVYKIGSLFVVAQNTAAEGVSFQGARSGVWTVPKETGSGKAWTEGARIYWDAGNARGTIDSIDGMMIGVAVAAAADGAAVGNVLLSGGAEGLEEGAQAAIADLTFGTNIAAATANDSLEDSAATNPSDANFDNNMKELGVKVNGILAVLRTLGLIASS